MLTGYTDLPSRLPTQSSTLYSNNISKFLLSLTPPGGSPPSTFFVDLNDEVTRGSIVIHQGEQLPRHIVSPPTPPPAPTQAKVEESKAETAITPWQKAVREVAVISTGMGGVVALGKATGAGFMDSFFTFGLAGLVGYRLVLLQIQNSALDLTSFQSRMAGSAGSAFAFDGASMCHQRVF